MEKTAEINHLTVAFQSDDQTLVAVDDLSFDIKSGETMALLGESGCGKSLTALALMRLLPTQSVYSRQSQINFSGTDLLEVSEKIMRSYRGRRMAIIFQEPMTALNPVLSIGEQLAEAVRQHHSLSRQEIKEKMLSLLEEVELPQPEMRLKQYPHQLSGGQKQRIVIAMALASEPELLIADEPTTALDVTIQAQILSLLKKLQQQHQMSMMLITHDLTVVKAVADSVCVMYAGQIVEKATVRQFFRQPLHPYSQELLVSLPTIEKRGQRLHSIKGNVPTLDAMPSGCRFHPRCAHVFEPCASLEPVLLPISEKRHVRCHLYPEHEHPPGLQDIQTYWTETEKKKEIILSVENLCIYFKESGGLFRGKKEPYKAVDDLSFELGKGKTLALVGESGCGKTTVAKALLRLLSITSGRILYRDEDITHLQGRALHKYRKNVQIIFQDPYSSMNPRMMVSDILAEGMLAQGMRAKYIQKRQLELLEQVNLPKKVLLRYPHQFSGGQRQRICIARALATDPELLVCDEPTSALDISVQAQILNLLKNLQQEMGLSYLFITHNMAVVAYIADDVLVMRQGKAVESGPCEQIFNQPQQEYTRKLLSSVLQI